MLNSHYTFDTFILGEGNKFVCGAAYAVADAPGKLYNPLFIHGGLGLGKTHLLHAIGERVLKKNKRAQVAYLPCERFANELIQAVQNSQIAKFRRKYLRTDVLLLDDIQFLTGKERIQEEFYQTLNALHEAKKQIVMTGSLAASQAQELEKRLVSRFEWGLATDLQPPDGKMRLAILQKKMGLQGIQLPEEIVQFLARRVHTNVRRLEEALTRVSTILRKLTMEVVKGLLWDILQQERRQSVSIEGVQYLVANHFDIPVVDMTKRRRSGSSVFLCQIAMYLCRNVNRRSLSSIRAAFGGCAEDVVLHACGLVKDRMKTDAHALQIVRHLQKQLSS